MSPKETKRVGCSKGRDICFMKGARGTRCYGLFRSRGGVDHCSFEFILYGATLGVPRSSLRQKFLGCVSCVKYVRVCVVRVERFSSSVYSFFYRVFIINSNGRHCIVLLHVFRSVIPCIYLIRYIGRNNRLVAG